MPSTDHPPCSSSVLRARSLLITRVTSRSTGLPVPRASLTLPAAWVYLVPVGRATVPPSGRRRQRLPRRGSHDARSRPILLHWPVPRERGNAARASRRSRGGRSAGVAGAPGRPTSIVPGPPGLSASRSSSQPVSQRRMRVALRLVSHMRNGREAHANPAVMAPKRRDRSRGPQRVKAPTWASRIAAGG
jgi:hypothetical protein